MTGGGYSNDDSSTPDTWIQVARRSQPSPRRATVETVMIGADVGPDAGSIARKDPDSEDRAHFQGRTRIAEVVRSSDSGSASVSMMQAADLRDRDNPTAGRWLNIAAHR